MTTRDDVRRGAATTASGWAAARIRAAVMPTATSAPCADRPAPPACGAPVRRARAEGRRPLPGRARHEDPGALPRGPRAGRVRASSRATSTRRASCATTRSTSGSIPRRSSASGGASAATRRVAKTVHHASPQPIAQPRPGLQFSPGVVVAALLTIADRRDRRLARRPGHALREAADARRDRPPRGDARARPRTRPRTRSRGRRSRARRSPSSWPAARARPRPTRPAPGRCPSTLRRGRNEFKIDATDPDTGKHAEDAGDDRHHRAVPARSRRPTFTVDQPADGTTFENGAIPVSGTASNAKGSRQRGLRRAGRRRARREPEAGGAPARPAAAAPPITIPVGDDGTWDTGDARSS